MTLQEFEHKRALDAAERLNMSVPCTIDQFKFGPVDPARQQRAVAAVPFGPVSSWLIHPLLCLWTCTA